MPLINELGQPIGDPVDGWTPRPRPVAAAMAGRWCRLEPLDPDRHGRSLFEALHADRSDRQWTYMAFGPFEDLDAFVRFLHILRSDRDLVAFAICEWATGGAHGMASYSRIAPEIGSIEVGGVMYGPTLQRTPAATEAMYLMAARVFDDLGYRRYEWKCDALNAASIVAARRLGFRAEGVWRHATIYKGRNRDTAWLALTDQDWLSVGPRIAHWLSPNNFTDTGQQRSSLSQLIIESPSPSSSSSLGNPGSTSSRLRSDIW